MRVIRGFAIRGVSSMGGRPVQYVQNRKTVSPVPGEKDENV
jgi:hypothetical protein